MDVIHTLSLSLGAAWASGINLYATVFVLGIMNLTGAVDLPPALEILSNPLVLTAAGIMYFVEFFADKIPGVDTAWDAIHTFIRIPAGVVLAASALGDVNPAYQFAAALVGGALATSTHATKAGTRVLINTSPEPLSNWTASIAEDIAVFVGVWAAVQHPWFFLGLLFLFVLSLVWLLPIIWGGLRRIASWFSKNLFHRKPPSSAVPITQG